MKTTTASSSNLRQPIRHFTSLTHYELDTYYRNGFIEGPLTEKTDGMAWEVGVDDEGFYTRTSNGPKIRKEGDYYKAAKLKFGDQCKSFISTNFDLMHHYFANDVSLLLYLTAAKRSIKGEMFWRAFGKQVDEGIQFVGTAYDPAKLGRYGTFVVHSQLNDADVRTTFDNYWINWDTDLVYPYIQLSLDGMYIHGYEAAYEYILNTMPKKWGNETEGYVIHPKNGPRLKFIDPRWKERRDRIK